MRKFLLGLAIGVLCSELAMRWVTHPVVLAQKKSDKAAQARVLTSGSLFGWNDFLFLTRDSQPIAGFVCHDPQLSIKDKTIRCLTNDPAIAKGPVLVGRSGALDGWSVNVSGEGEFDCREPAVDFESSSLTCPVQANFAQLQESLNQSRSDLEKIENQISRPAPWTINVATVPPHGYACPAGVIDIASGVLTCPALVPVF